MRDELFGAFVLVSDSRLYTVWGISLAVAALIVLVVAALLLLIWNTARSIERYAGRSLAAAERIAEQTAPIWALDDVNRVATDILVTTQSIERTGAEIADALEGKVRAGP
jgi:HAMP domain-containing protein